MLVWGFLFCLFVFGFLLFVFLFVLGMVVGFSLVIFEAILAITSK